MIPTTWGVSNRQSATVPDGRQIRIEFFPGRKQRNPTPHIVTPRRTVDFWQTITGWLRSSPHEREHRPEAFREFLEKRGYRKKTCDSYLYMLRKFFEYTDEKEVSGLSLGVIEDYNYDFFVSNRYSRSYQLQFINGMALYLEFAHGVKVNLKGLRRSVPRR